MALYAVGDIQGCFGTFERLLVRIAFDPARDRLWLVGDLVNRGPRSLEVLRWARAHDACVTAVLGNHDLHLLARALGLREAKPTDTVDDVLAAPDRDALLDWLRRRPFLHREGALVLVHAGLHPDWTVADAEARARELEAALGGAAWRAAMAAMYGAGRLHTLASVFTRIRICTLEGEPRYDFAGELADAPAGTLPWFRVPGRRSADHTIVFGHWAALGRRLEPGIVAADSGCVWGGELSAVRLPDLAVFSEPHRD